MEDVRGGPGDERRPRAEQRGRQRPGRRAADGQQQIEPRPGRRAADRFVQAHGLVAELEHFAEQGVQAEVIYVQGSVELAPLVGLSHLIVDLVETGAISGKMLKDLYDLCFERGQDFPAVYEKEKPQQITDTAAIEKIIEQVMAANPKQLEQYRSGKKAVKAFFLGQVMRATKGHAKPALVDGLLESKLG